MTWLKELEEAIKQLVKNGGDDFETLIGGLSDTANYYNVDLTRLIDEMNLPDAIPQWTKDWSRNADVPEGFMQSVMDVINKERANEYDKGWRERWDYYQIPKHIRETIDPSTVQLPLEPMWRRQLRQIDKEKPMYGTDVPEYIRRNKTNVGIKNTKKRSKDSMMYKHADGKPNPIKYGSPYKNKFEK